MKYCCEEFEFDVKVPSTTAPNIRIVQFLPQPNWKKKQNIYGIFYNTWLSEV